MVTSLPLGTLDMVPVKDFIDCGSLSPSYPACVLMTCPDINDTLGTSGEVLFNACQGQLS